MSAPESTEQPQLPEPSLDELMPDHAPSGPPFPVVGIGASAGGLESFSELLAHLPGNPGLAIVYVAHMEPHHKSHLPEILAKITSMPVCEVREGMTVAIDHVYLIPPNTNMALTDGKLALTPRSPVRGQHMPIDYLFRSLANIQKNRSIGVLLSGGGTDGTLGFQAIKAEGGITIAQDEKTATQPSMPRSAILDGNVDYVLAPRDIARQLVRLGHHPYARGHVPPAEPPAEATAAVNEILGLLRSVNGVDFAHYKQSTINRRIHRRIALRGCEGPADYLKLLHDDQAELSHLYQDFLIRVTQFFRDRESFEMLKEKVFPALAQNRAMNSPIRIWVAGCSTGEEVYSIAMVLLEFLESKHEGLPIKILATDLNEAALDKARAGLYVDNIEIDVSAERLRRFFNRVDGHYQITKSIRELCVFSKHNLCSDPPFSHLDLVSCRNVLIYMDATLQKRVLPILHYALNPDGFLFLGLSESVGPFTDLFNTVDSRHRIYSKRAVAPGVLLPVEFGAFAGGEGHLRRVREEGGPLWSALDVQREADRIVLGRYAPVGVVVDESMTVLQFRGRTASYLEPAPGLASLDLFRMLREGLLAEVRAAVTQARAENAIVTRTALRSSEGEPAQPARVEVIPFKLPSSNIRFFLVLFQEPPAQEKPPPVAPRPAEQRVPTDNQVSQLQQELSAMREYLQSVIEEQESTNEELKSANEEVLSANEELQSTNEELQTAKEEAQSANEELATVNEELRHRNAELARVNNDLVNLLSGVGIPIVMVSRDLRIRRFTPPAEKLFNLISTDVGRPISDIKPNLEIPDLAGIIAGVIDSLASHESTVQDTGGHLHYLRVGPYITLDKTIDGASVVLIDIDSIQRGLESSRSEAGIE
jgi:two-component system CheB/CheR fusion protein